jgi:hypothetical protein
VALEPRLRGRDREGLLAEGKTWLQPGIVANDMSANRNMPWGIETTQELID